MISKELLETVLKLKIQDYFIVFNDRIDLVYDIDSTSFNKIINIYELANLCKKYCCSTFDIKLYSEVRKSDSRCCISKHRNGELINKQITAKTEPEAIFNATEWLLRFKGIK